MNSTKEIAEQIVLRGYGTTWKTDVDLIAAIDSALRQREQEVRAEERERVARIIHDTGTEWGERAQARKSKTYSAYVIAALDLEGRIRDDTPQEGEREVKGGKQDE